MLAAVALIARGIFLGRPVTARHAITAAVVRVRRDGRARVVLRSARRRADRQLGHGADVADVVARRQPEDLPRVWALINATSGDPLAPFAMQAGKCYHFTADGTAALAYRTRMGYRRGRR